jgi:hypothetical protein
LNERELEMNWEVVRPLVKLGLEGSEGLKREIMCCSSRIILIQDLGQDTRGTEKSQSTGNLRGFAREGGLEAFFGDILVIGV